MTDDPESLRSHYDERANEFNEMYFGDPEGHPAPLLARDIVVDRLSERSVDRVLDMGCGNGGVLVSLLEEGFDAYGFDIAPELVEQAKTELDRRGYDPDRVVQANMEQTIPFEGSFDAIVGLGILPQLSDIDAGFEEVTSFVGAEGVVLLQFRNELMSLFSLNEYTYEFFCEELLGDIELPEEVDTAAKKRFAEAFRVDAETPGRSPDTDPEGEFHNPLTIDELFVDNGFDVKQKHFYHYHALPPVFEHTHPESFDQLSMDLEQPNDWRGYIMASAFIVEATPEQNC